MKVLIFIITLWIIFTIAICGYLYWKYNLPYHIINNTQFVDIKVFSIAGNHQNKQLVLLMQTDYVGTIDMYRLYRDVYLLQQNGAVKIHSHGVNY